MPIGALVTSFSVGMSDPLWPTEPWYLAVNQWVFVSEPAPGYLLEHTHRAVGWILGLLVSVMAVSVWLSTASGITRLVGLFFVVGAISFYGQLHREMLALNKTAYNAEPGDFPVQLMLMTAMAGLVPILLGIVQSVRGFEYGLTQLFASVSLVAVMVQGLLGGARVYLNTIAGPELALIHGIFAQFAIANIAITAFSSSRSPVKLTGLPLPKLAMLSLPLLAFVQISTGALFRHADLALGQKLHLWGSYLIVAFGAYMAYQTIAMLQVNPLTWVKLLPAVLLAMLVYAGVASLLYRPGSQLVVTEDVSEQFSAGVRSAHLMLGSIFFVTTIWLAYVGLSHQRSTQLDVST